MYFVVLRADGGPGIGAGHLTRMLALASAYSALGWTASFATSRDSIPALKRFGGDRYDTLLVSGTAPEQAKQIGRRWGNNKPILVVDNYQLDEQFERSCRSWAAGIVAIDDLANRKHNTDLLVDSGAASAKQYDGLVQPGALVLTGAPYAIIGPEYINARRTTLPRCRTQEVRRVLITFGQNDPRNATSLALDAVREAQFEGAVDIVLGSGAPHRSEVEKRSNERTAIHFDVPSLRQLITSCDVAVGAGGVTAFERACLGLASIVITTEENQRGVVSTLDRAGAIVNAGNLQEASAPKIAGMLRHLLTNGDDRRRISAAGASLIDGYGASRIVSASLSTVRP